MEIREWLNFVVSLVALIVTILVKRKDLADAFKEIKNRLKQFHARIIAKDIVAKLGSNQTPDNIQHPQVYPTDTRHKSLRLSIFDSSFGFVLGVTMALFTTSVFIYSLIPILAPGGYISLFWITLVIFSITGFERGFARELMVVFGSVLALVINDLVERYLLNTLTETSSNLFWLRTLILIFIAYTSYQVTKKQRLIPKDHRHRVQEGLLGILLGAISGYLIVGTLWYYLHSADYNIYGLNPPNFDNKELVQEIIKYMPPSALLKGGNLYATLFIMLVFVILVFI